jgi:hypothetical protein
VHLKKNALNGHNTINVVARDKSGAIGIASVVNVLYNVAPSITILSPLPGAILDGVNPIEVKGTDDNGDSIHYRYQIAPVAQPADWQTIVDTPYDNIYFDTTKFLDGEYIMQVLADDGSAVSVASVSRIRIRNESSFFIRFYNGLNVVVNQRSALVRGVVYAQKHIIPEPFIKSLEYSLNAGKNWIKVQAQDGEYNESEEHFEVSIKNLKIGVNDIVWRTTDSRGIIVKSDEPITVDMLAPKAPIVSYPDSSITLTKDNNETTEKGKFIFTLRGKTEPDANIQIDIDGKSYTSRASFDGSFRVGDISLSKAGKYNIRVLAIDQALNKSPTVEYGILYDNMPNVVFTNPVEGRGLNSKAILSWLASDIDDNHITNDYLGYSIHGKPFVELDRNIKTNTYEWDTTRLPESNDYNLRLKVSDGFLQNITTIHISVDRTPPVISSLSVDKDIYSKGDILKSVVGVQDIHGGVLFVEYRIIPKDEDIASASDIPWYKANKVNDGLFTITKNLNLKDGLYSVVTRAVDNASNESEEMSESIAIDTTPPRMGSLQITNNGVDILPDGSMWNMSLGVSYLVTVSLEDDTKSATLSLDGKDIPLVKEESTGLWKSILTFDKAGELPLYISAIDKRGNSMIKEPLIIINAHEQSSIVKNSSHSWWDSFLYMVHLK